MKATVRTPASTANLGAGFDIFALALQLQNEVRAESADGVVDVDGVDYRGHTDDHLIAKAYALVCRRLGVTPGVSMSCVNNIPMGKGLGSSAAAALSGVLVAVALHRAPWDENQIIDCVAELEHHRDNAAASLLGGLTICAEGIPAQRIDVPDGLSAVLFIPDAELPTAEARKVVPQTFPRGDAVFNASRCALLVRAFLTHDYTLLASAMQDRWHQTQRATLIPWLPELLEAGVKVGAATALSGAGPSVLALTSGDTTAVTKALEDAATKNHVDGKTMVLRLRNFGTRVDVSQ